MSTSNIMMVAKLSLATIVAFIAKLTGGWDSLLTALMTLMVADYITGVVAAAHSGELSSRKGMIGLLKKGCIMLIILVAAQLDIITGQTNMIFRSTATLYYIANEGMSIIENMAILGLPIPSFIGRMFATMKVENDD